MRLLGLPVFFLPVQPFRVEALRDLRWQVDRDHDSLCFIFVFFSQFILWLFCVKVHAGALAFD